MFLKKNAMRGKPLRYLQTLMFTLPEHRIFKKQYGSTLWRWSLPWRCYTGSIFSPRPGDFSELLNNFNWEPFIQKELAISASFPNSSFLHFDKPSHQRKKKKKEPCTSWSSRGPWYLPQKERVEDGKSLMSSNRTPAHQGLVPCVLGFGPLSKHMPEDV